MLTAAQEQKAKSLKLSENFFLWELIRSDKYPQHVDYPCPFIVRELRSFAQGFLQPVRQQWGRIRINSGYRNPALNKAVGGISNSIHQIIVGDDILNVAVDIRPLDAKLGDVFQWCNPANLPGLKTAIIYEADGFIHLDTRANRPKFERFKKVGKDYIPI